MCWVESRTVLPLRERSRDLSAGAARRLTSAGQQAPGFCAQKSSNFCPFDPAGGGEPPESAPAVGAAAPPPVDAPPVDVPPVPVEGVEVPVLVPVGVPVDPVEPVLPVEPV